VKYIAFLKMSLDVVDRALEVDKKRKEEGRAVKTIFPARGVVISCANDYLFNLCERIFFAGIVI
jgi:hypothetical protein